MTQEPDLHLRVNGCRVDGSMVDDVYAFRLPPSPGDVRIISRAGAQDELGLSRDPRVLGVGVRRIILWRGRQPAVIEADDPLLSEGFHAYEADNGFRWTDGDAVVPAACFRDAGCVAVLEIYVAGSTKYPLLDSQCTIAA